MELNTTPNSTHQGYHPIHGWPIPACRSHSTQPSPLALTYPSHSPHPATSSPSCWVCVCSLRPIRYDRLSDHLPYPIANLPQSTHQVPEHKFNSNLTLATRHQHSTTRLTIPESHALLSPSCLVPSLNPNRVHQPFRQYQWKKPPLESSLTVLRSLHSTSTPTSAPSDPDSPSSGPTPGYTRTEPQWHVNGFAVDVGGTEILLFINDDGPRSLQTSPEQ